MKGPGSYQIIVAGRISESWADWFTPMHIEPCFLADGTPATRIAGFLPDQPALFGILNTIRDLNLELVRLEIDGVVTGQPPRLKR